MYNFLKEERLCGEQLIDKLFHDGSSFVLYPYRVFWLPQSFETVQARVVISVPKRRFKLSVDRNLLKRRIREAYRLHKSTAFYPGLREKNSHLFVGITYIGKEISEFKFIEKKMIAVFEKINAAVHVSVNL